MTIDARHIAGLDPSEAAAITSARAARAAELATGARCCTSCCPARPGPIPRSGSGAPVWPIGTVDSLAHDDQYVVLAIARRDRYAGIGTDLEPDDHDRELREEVLRDDDPII